MEQCRCCGSFLDPQLEHAETCSNAEATREHFACVHAVVCGMKLADSGITTEPRGLTASKSRLTDFLTTAAVSGRSAALAVCVASSIAAAARGEAAQAAFDRKLSHYRNEIGELRQQGIHCRPRALTADGWPHPAVTRTLQHAADIASSRNGQHLSAKSLHRAWKHEIQIALLRRRAAMARAVLPNLSAWAEWLFAGIIDGALHHWGHVPALDGGPGDHDLEDFETDTAIPDDDDGTNLCGQQVSGSPVRPSASGGTVGWRWISHTMSRARSVSGQYPCSTISTSRTVSRTQGVSGQQVLDLLALEDDVFQQCLSA